MDSISSLKVLDGKKTSPSRCHLTSISPTLLPTKPKLLVELDHVIVVAGRNLTHLLPGLNLVHETGDVIQASCLTWCLAQSK